jgi:hypothetical protein
MTDQLIILLAVWMVMIPALVVAFSLAAARRGAIAGKSLRPASATGDPARRQCERRSRGARRQRIFNRHWSQQD